MEHITKGGVGGGMGKKGGVGQRGIGGARRRRKGESGGRRKRKGRGKGVSGGAEGEDGESEGGGVRERKGESEGGEQAGPSPLPYAVLYVILKQIWQCF